MEGAAAAAPAAGELLSPAEADWPPELRLPPPPPAAASEGEPPPARAAMGMDDSQFLGSIIGLPAQPPQATVEALTVVGVKRRRGRPPKKRDGAATAVIPAAKPARRREDEEEVVCFICFDGGNLVVCDRRGCPKVYHPACIKRDEAFFQSRSKWNCGWHICSSCEKAVHYMCYTCTYSLCKVCIKQGKFFSVRGTKGFCDTCYSTILLIESKDEGDTKIVVDFDDQNSWEYLFKLYWLDLKGKLSLTLEELTSAKSRWNAPTTYTRKEKDESSDDLYDANNDDDAGSDCSSGKRKRNSSTKKGRKRWKPNSDCSIATKKVETVTRDAGTLSNKVPTEEASLPLDAKWASPELLEFVGHMRDGDQSFISQFDVQALLLDYIKQNNLRDPQRKSQIICDSRLHRLFRKTRVAHFEMLKLLEMHFLVSEPSAVNDGSQGIINPNSAQIDHVSGYSDMAAKFSPDKRRRMHRKMEREPQANPEDYAAIDMHNINLIYLRRSLMEDLIDDPTFSEKISGAFVRIRISGLGQKQDMYRLVKVVGTHKVSEKYSVGKKMTHFALEIMNLNKKEIITMDTVSNQDFTEEECKRLRQSMKYDLISRLKVGDIQEKAKIFQFIRVNDLLNTPEERARRINEVLDVHVDSHMDPDYESDEEFGNKKAVERNVNWARSDPFVSPIKVKYSNTSQKNGDATRHHKNLSKQNTECKSEAARNFENSHSSVGMDIPKSGTNVKSTMCETTSLSSSGVVSSDMEPEKVWHYKDPSGNIQGPFTLVQLSKWTSYFPRDMRVWLTFESEERSLLLTEVLSKQPKDFGQPASVTTSSKSTLADTGQNRNTQIVDLNRAPSPVGYSMLNSFETTVQSTKHSAPERESVNSLDDRLSHSTDSVPPKDTNASNSQAMCQIKHSGSLPSPGSPHQRSDLHHDEVQGGRSGEWNNQLNSELWSPSMPQTSSSAHSNVESHHDHYPSWSQVQHDPKNSLQAGSGKDLNSRQDFLQKLPSQRTTRDVPSPVFAWSPSESRTASSQHEGSCLSSTTNLCTHDELHSSIASAKAKSFAPATPVEDRGSSSPSGMLSHSERAPICSPQSAPSASDTCKMEEIMNQQKTLEADISNTSVNQSPQKILPESSPDNQDAEHEYRSPPPISESKALSPQSRTTPESSPDNQDTEREYPSPPPISGSKEISPQSRTVPESSPDNQDIGHEYPSPPPIPESIELSPHSKVLPESSPDNQDIEPECPSPPQIPESKELSRQSKILLESSPDNQDIKPVHPSPPQIPGSEELSRQSKILPESSPDNQDIKCEYSSPTPIPKSKELSLQSKILPESSSDNQDIKREDPSPIPVSKSKELSPQSKILSESYRDNQDVEREYPSSVLISESKELAVDLPGSISLAPEKIVSTDVGENSSLAFIFPKSPPAGDGALKSVSDIAKAHLEGEDSNVKEELYVESTVVIRDDMVVNPVSGVESIDMSENLLESLMEQSCGTFYMDGTTTLEGFLSGSTKEEPQCSSPIALSTCSSPIALSPWGEHGYYQGDSVGSSLWGVQDDEPISNIWPLSTQTPALQYSSGSTAHFIDEVTVTHGNNGVVLSTTPGEEVGLPNSGVCVDWGLVEQVNPEANDASISMIDKNTGLEYSQPSANDGSDVGTARKTNHNTNLSLNHETAVPLSRSSGEASKKHGFITDLNVATSGKALGDTKNWNPSAGNANRGSQRNHHRDRYSQISESWLLSSNYSRSRSDGYGTGGSSRSTPRGQTQRGICKFHENGYCRKGASYSKLIRARYSWV
uniref:Zinc finger CCCH domain-containing protein 44 n=1 Tax=Oryza punctata TaxID=4537 RepID=A0A0E0K7S9_ORYPU